MRKEKTVDVITGDPKSKHVQTVGKAQIKGRAKNKRMAAQGYVLVVFEDGRELVTHPSNLKG